MESQEAPPMRRKLAQQLHDLLHQGYTPEKVALTIALGVALGTIPLLGTTTLLCTAAAALLKLNLPIIQLVNWAVYPAQLALWIPFLRMGARLFGNHSPVATAGSLLNLARCSFGQAAGALWTATLHAVAAWAICSLVMAVLAYRLLVPLIRRVGAENASPAP